MTKPGEKARFYAWAWKLVYLLDASQDDRHRLQHYLRMFASGTEPHEAALAAFGDLDALEIRLDALVPDPLGGRENCAQACADGGHCRDHARSGRNRG